jgi:hypothetical protein
MTILTLSILLHTGAPILSAYADKCEHEKDSRCESKDATSSDDNGCKDSSKDNDSEKSNNNVRNSNDESSSIVECSESELQSNPHSLGEGPYSFPTDFSELPI